MARPSSPTEKSNSRAGAANYITDLDTPYYWEIIFENGDFSAGGESTANNLLPGLRDHHMRAKSGLAGGPPDDLGRTVPSIRIKRVLAYEGHPGDVPTSLSADEWLARVTAALKGKDALTIDELDQEIAPYALKESAPHDSNYVKDEVGELDPALWEAGDN